jgi:hypothetical protein
MVGSCEHDNEPCSYVKGGEFLDKQNDYLLLKKGSIFKGHTVPFSGVMYRLNCSLLVSIEICKKICFFPFSPHDGTK